MDPETAARRARIVRRVAIGSVIVVVGLVVLGIVRGRDADAPSTGSAADPYVQEYGSNRSVIEAILRSSDCAALGDMFDAADANRQAFGVGTPRSKDQLGRMAAADDRMQTIGCY